MIDWWFSGGGVLAQWLLLLVRWSRCVSTIRGWTAVLWRCARWRRLQRMVAASLSSWRSLALDSVLVVSLRWFGSCWCLVWWFRSSGFGPVGFFWSGLGFWSSVGLVSGLATVAVRLFKEVLRYWNDFFLRCLEILASLCLWMCALLHRLFDRKEVQ